MDRTDVVVESIISPRFRLLRASSTTAINDTCFPKKHLKGIGMQDKQRSKIILFSPLLRGAYPIYRSITLTFAYSFLHLLLNTDGRSIGVQLYSIS